MLASLDCTISIRLSMVNTKAGGKVGQQKGQAAAVAIGLFYNNKLQIKSESKTGRKKVVKEKTARHTVTQPDISEHVTVKKTKIIRNPVCEAIIQDKFASPVSNGKTAVWCGSQKQRDWNRVTEKFAGKSKLGSSNAVSKLGSSNAVSKIGSSNAVAGNIYSKVYLNNFSRTRHKRGSNFDSKLDRSKVTKLRINLVKYKLSSDQLVSLQLKTLPRNDSVKNRRFKLTDQTKDGIPVHIITDVSSIIIDQVLPGKVSRIPHSLRYIKPSRSADNYGLGNKQDIEYDDSDCPRKDVPRWAQGDMLDQALGTQEQFDTDQIFSTCEPPNLDLMFPQAAAKRDIWRTPPSSYSSRYGQLVEEKQEGGEEDLVKYVTGRLENKDK